MKVRLKTSFRYYLEVTWAQLNGAVRLDLGRYQPGHLLETFTTPALMFWPGLRNPTARHRLGLGPAWSDEMQLSKFFMLDILRTFW